MKLEAREILQQLVAIPSVNPMGADVAGPHYGTRRLSDYLEKTLRQLGLEVDRQAVDPTQHNLLAQLDGQPGPEQGGHLLLLGAHQDTVPVEGMQIPPFAPTIRDGRLYGRGACDVKGGLAAMIAAVARLAELPATKRPTVVLACTVNEEYGFTGAATLVHAWNAPPRLLPRKPDAAVIAEPTGLDVVVAHKGVVRWRCHARGRAAHSSRPELGDNAIYKMARCLVALERYQNQVVGMLASHPLCGRSTISVGTIRGGTSVNIVPDRATIEIDRRLPPGETPETARQHLIEYLAGQELGFVPEHELPDMQGPPLSDTDNADLAECLARLTIEQVGHCRKVGVPYATDAAFLSAAGVPSVVFGPGAIEQAHTDSEWIDLAQLDQAAEIYYRFVRAWK
jgi:acetylornithine deacetylase/succinyl-diaminopimelate desuccinylase family protein